MEVAFAAGERLSNGFTALAEFIEQSAFIFGDEIGRSIHLAADFLKVALENSACFTSSKIWVERNMRRSRSGMASMNQASVSETLTSPYKTGRRF